MRQNATCVTCAEELFDLRHAKHFTFGSLAPDKSVSLYHDVSLVTSSFFLV